MTTVAVVWIPLAAELTPTNVAANEQTPTLLRELLVAIRYVLGDTHCNDPTLRTLCAACDRELVAPRRGASSHTEDGLEALPRQRAPQRQFKGVFDYGGPIPTRGLLNTRLFILGVVLVCQL